MNFDLEIRTIEFLQKKKNYHATKFLQQFNSKFQNDLILKFPNALKWSLKDYEKKQKHLSNCIKCGKIYNSEQTAEEAGVCWACNFKESEKFLKMSLPNYIIKVRKKAEKIMPHYLGKQLMREIQIYFVENYRKEFMLKNKAFLFINEKFNLNLTNREVLALLEPNVLRRAGLL
jgi:hypothetical protein